jgi:hypothetical protein
MSYILESLKKSDKERQGAENSVTVALGNDAHFMAAKDTPNSSFVTLLITIAVVFLFLVFFWWKTNSVDDGIAVLHERSSLPLTEELLVKPVATLQKENAILPVVLPDVIEIIEVNGKSAVSLIEAVLVDKVNEETHSLYDENVQPVTDEDIATLYQEGAESPERKVDNKRDSIVPSAKIASVELVVPELMPAASIPSIYDLDRSTQKKIPTIAYGAHIYASDNKSGFVILNGAKRKAGEKMRSGIYIERVGEAELVLSYQGLVFSLPAMKSWKP